MMFTPWTTTRCLSGRTCRTWPCLPRFLPAMTSTVSSRLIRCISHHFRRQRDDLHEVALPQLPRHRPEDAGAPRVLLVRQEDGGVLIEPDVRPVPPPVG